MAPNELPDGTVLHKVVKVEERSTEDSMLIRSETDGTSSGSSTGSEADGTAAGSGAGTGSEAGGTSSGSSTGSEASGTATGSNSGSGTSDTAPGSNSEQTAKKNEDQLDTFRVELCFLVTDEYRTAFKTIEELIIYVAVLVNAVKLRYLDMKDPRIRFQFNGIDLIAESNFVVYHGSDVDGTETLANVVRMIIAGQYGSCDAVFVLTSKLVKVKEGNSYNGAHGAAVTGGVCTEKKVGIVTDIPRAYSGVRTLSHELGHTLGSVHDGADPKPNIPGHLGGKMCRPDKGFLMSSGYLGTNKYKLSTCTKKQIQAYVKTLPKNCTDVQANANYSTTSYPGQGTSRRELCKLRHPNKPEVIPYNDNSTPTSKCVLKCCWRLQDHRYTCALYNMLDKMECEAGKTCRRGVCDAHKWA
uniref:Peptidase M12B domain-containing protein n=1 Tax=Amblyomma maculatum TaxID=34609 RepID=G3MRD6_AMBMU